MQHDDMNDLLNRRKNPPARSGLAERIIHAALQHPQEKMRASDVWNEILAMLAIPHPSVAVAAGIVLGLMMGMEASDGLSILQQDWSSFLVINEGGWL